MFDQVASALDLALLVKRAGVGSTIQGMGGAIRGIGSGIYDIIGSGTAGSADAIRRLTALPSGRTSATGHILAGGVRVAPWVAGAGLAVAGGNRALGDPIGREYDYQKELLRQRMGETRAVWDPRRGMMV